MSEIYHEFMTTPPCLLIWQKKFIYQGLYFSSGMTTLPPEIEAGVIVIVRSSIVMYIKQIEIYTTPPPLQLLEKFSAILIKCY